MAEKISPSKKQVSPDWLVQGILTKIGDTFDRLTGRRWKPSSSLATSELTERLTRLIDSEVRRDGTRTYAPHNIQLKMQWDKFSTDSEDALRKLETALLTALVDHINDKRYYTYPPITLQVKPDYFTTGVKLFVGFEKSEEDRETAIDVSMPGFADDRVQPQAESQASKGRVRVIVRFDLQGRPFSKELVLEAGKRLSVGRTKENDLAVDDTSVSKLHASIMLNAEGRIVVADTGSTNGTFIDGERISYGKASTISQGHKLRLGTVELSFEIFESPVLSSAEPEHQLAKTEAYAVGEFEFTSKISEPSGPESAPPAETLASIPMPPAPTEPSIDLDLSDDEQVISK
ncbi:MAG: FHA domain-containing protein [Pyrinomonadaceae bacterium]